MRKLTLLPALALAGLMCVAATSAPADKSAPPAGKSTPDKGKSAADKAEFEDCADRILSGEALTEDEMAQVRKGFEARLIRPDLLDFGQNARYRIAEIQLSHGKAQEAVSTLRELASAPAKADETIWVIHFDIAEIFRVVFKDLDQAAAEFQQVQGNMQPLAQREMLDMLERDPKRFDQAVSTIRKAADETKEKGARWALLTRLGNLYRRVKQDDKAVEVFQQIAKEATPDQIERLRAEATARVEAAAKQIRRLRGDGRDEEAEDVENGVVRQCNALRIQGRDDEADAMQTALDRLDEELKRDRPPAGASTPSAPNSAPYAV